MRNDCPQGANNARPKRLDYKVIVLVIIELMYFFLSFIFFLISFVSHALKVLVHNLKTSFESFLFTLVDNIIIYIANENFNNSL